MSYKKEDHLPRSFRCAHCEDRYDIDLNGEPSKDMDGSDICYDCEIEMFDRCDNCGIVHWKDDYKNCPECGEKLKENKDD